MALIDPTFLFRFEIDLQQGPLKWGATGLKLPEECQVPTFGVIAERPVYADVRAAWSGDGLGFTVSVEGKRSLPWCRDSRLEDSDGFHVWVDTRNSPNIHRATQFCHRFLFMPAGGGPKRETPVASLLPINRARANPKPIGPKALKVAALPRHDGYKMSCWIPAAAMTGFDPVEQPTIGFYFAVIDRELGWQTMTLGPEYPVVEDPSLWCQAKLT